MKILLSIISGLIGAALIAMALYWRIPALFPFRPLIFKAIIIISLIGFGLSLWLLMKTRPMEFIVKSFASLGLLASLLALSLTLMGEARFVLIKNRVLSTETSQLNILGRHIIVGYTDVNLMRLLIKKQAVGGAYITTRNVEGKNVNQLKGVIDSFQETSKENSERPLWIATDQEGGIVERLSPPLPRQESLKTVVKESKDQQHMEISIKNWAEKQAQGLAQVGVNLNFAPVVDLNHNIVNPDDKYSRIYQRAISNDPEIVSNVAKIYCAQLEAEGIRCVLKHFPGLGRVFEDTHKSAASLTTPMEILERTDMAPFETMMRTTDSWMMLSHLILAQIDRENPVSMSKKVVSGLIREKLGYKGVLITDNVTMAAFYNTGKGFRAAGVQSLNAGVDILLVSYDPDQYFYLMDALLKAYASGELNREVLDQSKKRIYKSMKQLVLN